MLRIAVVLMTFYAACACVAQEHNAYDQAMKMRRNKDTFMWQGKPWAFEELAQNSLFKQEINKLVAKQFNPKDTLSHEVVDRMIRQMVELRMVRLQDKAAPVQAVGFAVLPEIYESEKAFLDKTFEDFRKEFIDKELKEDFAARLIDLRNRIAGQYKVKENAKQVCLRAEPFDHKSVIRHREERWLLIEVDLTSNKYDHVLLNKIYDTLQRRDPVLYAHQIPQHIQPHPETEEIVFQMQQPQKLAPNRNTESDVVVKDDSLTIAQREGLYAFSVKNNVKADLLQIESIGSDSDEASELLDLVSERIAISKLYKFEEVHLRLGNAVKHFQNRGKVPFIKFRLENDRNGYVEVLISTK